MTFYFNHIKYILYFILLYIKKFIIILMKILPSKYKNRPSLLLQGFLYLTTTAYITFFLSLGVPFLMEAKT